MVTVNDVSLYLATLRTLVHGFELADDVQPNIGELVFEQMQEERQQVLDGCFLAEQRCQPGDLGRDGRTNVLGTVLAEIADAWDDARENNLLFNRLREA